ncbi:MAG: biotin-dependent carboxyltransferase family protein [Paracoccaceae bacterium]
MSRVLRVEQIGPGTSVQDLGRRGFHAFGLSQGGAVDRRAMAEGAALLAQSEALPAVEMAMAGGVFRAGADMRIALTGGEMAATLDGVTLAWNACHAVPAGAQLRLGPVRRGQYGYLHCGGGIAAAPLLGSASAHLAAGLGRLVAPGDDLVLGDDPAANRAGTCLRPDDRLDGGTVRIVAGPQTALFSPEARARFEATVFRRDTAGNRMGVRLIPDGEGFQSASGLSILSEIVVPGDIQITGDGTPYVLLAECQTTGGYPRIGTCLPCDRPRVAQAAPGTSLRFRFVTMAEADEAERRDRAERAALRRAVMPLLRDPATITDLLSYQLISGAITGDEGDGGRD